MNTLRDVIVPSLASEQDRVANDLYIRIAHSSAPHYQTSEPGLLKLRCHDAVAAFRSALENDVSAFSRFIRFIAVERMGAGYQLREIQLVLNELEELMWKLCVTHVEDKDELIHALSVISGIAGQAKDELARVYVEQTGALAALGRSHQPEVDLLFDGT
jgi:hypothetical protein